MFDVWKCPNRHMNDFRVTENSPDINCVVSDDRPCEECNIEFNPDTWESLGLEYDDD